ncbi:conserved hypothetical protein [Magnetospirillum molischianum DSM 120]|uniref:Uncharacterized protein n=2 Tax=Magnetospirillum molischianum TaxID=1083 RepID=H8FP49_MAGML|nr:conserved hypothetical protein [Magnetospirillum molischianum DSM 120]
MAKKRLTGMPMGAVDLDRDEVQFTLRLGANGEIDLVAKAGVVEQVISGLARMCAELRARSLSGGKARVVPAEGLSSAHIQRDRLQDVVLVQFVTDRGVPHTFAIPLDDAADIAARLKTESERDVPAGSA